MAYPSAPVQSYPSETVDPKKKNSSYIAQYGRAFYSEFLNSGDQRWYNARVQYKEFIDYANGRQSVARYKSKIEDKETHGGHRFKKHNIDYSILPLVPKYLNLIGGLISQQQYEATATAIDAVAQSEKEDYEYKLRAMMNRQQLVSQLGLDMAPDGGQIPLDEDELQLKIGFGWQHWSAMKVEMGVNRALYNSQYEQIQVELDADARILGHFCYKDYLENGEPRVKRIDPRYAFIPYSDSEDYRDIDRAGHIEWLTISQIKRLAGDQLTEDEYEEIARKYKGNNAWGEFDNRLNSGYPYDSQKVPVFNFEFLSYDEMVFINGKDKQGNKTFHQRGFKSTNANTTRKGYHCLYEGMIIPNTNFSFNCRKAYDQKRDPNNLTDCTLSYHPFSPGMMYGVPVSMVEKIKVPADLAQRAWIRINDAWAKAVPKGYAIDLDKVENIILGSGGKMTTAEILEFHQGTGYYLYRGKDSEGNPINARNGIDEMENGMATDVERNLNIIRESISIIEGITGINATTAGQTNPDIGKGVSQIALQSANNAISYLYHARKMSFQKVCKALAIRVYDHLERGEIYGSYTSHNGMRQKSVAVSINREEAKKIIKHRFDFTIGIKPTQQEWQQFYGTAQRALDAGHITLADYTFLTEVDNLKQARALLSIREKRNKLEAAQKAQADMQMNAQVQMESAQAAEAAKQETLKLEFNLKGKLQSDKHTQTMEYEILRNKGEMDLQRLRTETQIETKHIEGENMAKVKIIEGDNYEGQIQLQHDLNPKQPVELNY